jgi:hypothetical protein
MFSRIHHLSLFRARWMLPMHSKPISLRCILILFSHPCIGLASNICPSGFFTNTFYAFFFSHMFHMLSSPHPSWFDHINSNWWGVQLTKLFILQFPPVSCYFLLRSPKYLPQHPIFNTLSLCSSFIMCSEVSHLCKTTGKITVLYTLVFLFLGTRQEGRQNIFMP